MEQVFVPQKAARRRGKQVPEPQQKQPEVKSMLEANVSEANRARTMGVVPYMMMRPSGPYA